MKPTILITGITGFLGSHIGELLINNEYKIIATKRKSSNLKNCSEFKERINWVNLDEDDWKEKVISQHPQTIIHAAWIGVEADERNDWYLQTQNIFFLQQLLEIANLSYTTKIIGLGSQAEYGFIDTVVTENHPLQPTTSYGAVKIIVSQLLKAFSVQHSVDWYWLRVFSVFGEKESTKWLLPNVITTIANSSKSAMDFSLGEQQYAYLYVKDFANAVKSIVEHRHKNSDIYNISASKAATIKSIITDIKNIISPAFELNFGTLPYRQNQSMLIAGNTAKYNQIFGEIDKTSFESAIKNTIQFYISTLAHESI